MASPAVVIDIKTKTHKPREKAVKAFDGYFDTALTGALTDNPQAFDTALTADAIAAIEHINRDSIVIDLTADHDSKEAQHIIAGMTALLTHFESGKEISITGIIKKTAKENPQFSYRLLTDKCKPLLIDTGVLVQINPTKYQWATLENTDKCTNDVHMRTYDVQMTDKNVHMPRQWMQLCTNALADDRFKFLELASPQQWADWCMLFHAKRSKWCEVLPDGTIQRHRKPFCGILTDEEKEILREQAKQKALAKYQAKQAPMSEETAALMEQKQQELIIRRAEQKAQMDTFWMWAKMIGIIAIILFLINSAGTGEKPTEQLPQGIQSEKAQ